MEIKSCCRDLNHMFEERTDNEAYGPLGWVSWGEVTLGSILKPINYCPWCGEKIEGVEIESTE